MEYNLLTDSDSYKVSHAAMAGSHDASALYMEGREGAGEQEMVLFGLLGLMKEKLEGSVVTMDKIKKLTRRVNTHLPGNSFYKEARFTHILEEHGGHLPISIRAIPEGLPVPRGTALLTVESTCSECAWLPGYLETVFSRLWYPSTVATKSRATKRIIREYLIATGCDPELSNQSLHDFGSRGVSSSTSAAIGGAAHLVNGTGTDTMIALDYLEEYYDADPETLAFSIPATEHSLTCEDGEDGELEKFRTALRVNPTGFVSLVADTFNLKRAVFQYICRDLKEEILARDGKTVVRPDSDVPGFSTPGAQVVWILEQLRDAFGGKVNSKGFFELHRAVGLIWGDGLDFEGIVEILEKVKAAGFATSNCAFGQGGGLLQRVNRDDLRFAIKLSAIKRDGAWHPVSKRPTDISKRSKAGRFSVIEYEGKVTTVDIAMASPEQDLLREVFRDGVLLVDDSFDQIRERARLA